METEDVSVLPVKKKKKNRKEIKNK